MDGIKGATRMKVALLAFVTALLLSLTTAAEARADLIYWSYSWTNSPNTIEADTPGTGSVSLTNESTHTAEGNSNIVATDLRTSSNAPDSNPAMFTNKGYSLVLSLTDNASGQTGTLTFNGVLNGTLTKTSSNIQNTFLGSLTQKVLLGNNVYTVTIGPYTPPGPPNSANAGSVSGNAQVTVTNVQTTPEPSTYVLSLGALLIFVAYGSRRLRWTPRLA
jgi:hypothetical protein